MPSNTYDVIITGGAAAGSAAAYFLTANPDFDGKVLRSTYAKQAAYEIVIAL